MLIKYAILGLLRRGPQTGYDLKKMLNASPALCRQDNDNQIYKTLTMLLREGLAASRVRDDTGRPAKKVYSITESGLEELKRWIASAPEPPRTENSFLIRLAEADLLEDNELDALFEAYEKEVKLQLLMLQEKIRRESAGPGSARNDAYPWKLMAEYAMRTYSNELQWLKKLREACGKNHREVLI